MIDYERRARKELEAWQRDMMKRPGMISSFSKKLQTRMNNLIPEKVHTSMTAAIREMIKGVLFGAGYISSDPLRTGTLQQRETMVLKKIETYRNTAAVEGGLTGAGGILLGLADFPVLIGIKVKLLFEIAALYGFDANDYRERVYLLYIFELAFSSDAHRKEVYLEMSAWEQRRQSLPANINQFDWRSFQQEYRDYIDLAKMAQMVPLIGAPVGAIVNYRLLKKLGNTAMNAYRLRLWT